MLIQRVRPAGMTHRKSGLHP
ncbi:hypothetical protein TNCV_1961711, partial [Trichonephila clavipes]